MQKNTGNSEDSVPTLEDYNWIPGKNNTPYNLPLESQLPHGSSSRGRTASWFTDSEIEQNEEGKSNRHVPRRVQFRAAVPEENESQRTFEFKEFTGYKGASPKLQHNENGTTGVSSLNANQEKPLVVLPSSPSSQPPDLAWDLKSPSNQGGGGGDDGHSPTPKVLMKHRRSPRQDKLAMGMDPHQQSATIPAAAVTRPSPRHKKHTATKGLEQKQDERARKAMMSGKGRKEGWGSSNSSVVQKRGSRKNKPASLVLESSAYEFTDQGGTVVNGSGAHINVPSTTVTNGEQFVWRGGSAATKTRSYQPTSALSEDKSMNSSYLPGLLNSKSLQDRVHGKGQDWRKTPQPWVSKSTKQKKSPTKKAAANPGGGDGSTPPAAFSPSSLSSSSSSSASPDKVKNKEAMEGRGAHPQESSWAGLYTMEFGEAPSKRSFSSNFQRGDVEAGGKSTTLRVNTELPSPKNEAQTKQSLSCRHRPTPDHFHTVLGSDSKAGGGRPVSRRSSRPMTSKSGSGQRGQRKISARSREGARQQQLMAFNL